MLENCCHNYFGNSVIDRNDYIIREFEKIKKKESFDTPMAVIPLWVGSMGLQRTKRRFAFRYIGRQCSFKHSEIPRCFVVSSFVISSGIKGNKANTWLHKICTFVGKLHSIIRRSISTLLLYHFLFVKPLRMCACGHSHLNFNHYTVHWSLFSWFVIHDFSQNVKIIMKYKHAVISLFSMFTYYLKMRKHLNCT